jgi:hypothetical protein
MLPACLLGPEVSVDLIDRLFYLSIWSFLSLWNFLVVKDIDHFDNGFALQQVDGHLRQYLLPLVIGVDVEFRVFIKADMLHDIYGFRHHGGHLETEELAEVEYQTEVVDNVIYGDVWD